MISDDLVALFQPAKPAAPFSQGVILSFDPSTGSNSVNLAGSILTDLPVLNSGDTVNFAAGDAVVLMRLGGSMAILGRCMVPGNAGFSAQSTRTEVASSPGLVSNFGVPLSATTVATCSTITTPDWANHVAVHVSGFVSARNSSASNGFLYAEVDVFGTGALRQVYVSALAGAFTGISPVEIGSGTVTAGQTFSPALLVSTDSGTGAWAANSNNLAFVTAIAVFSKQ